MDTWEIIKWMKFVCEIWDIVIKVKTSNVMSFEHTFDKRTTIDDIVVKLNGMEIERIKHWFVYNEWDNFKLLYELDVELFWK